MKQLKRLVPIVAILCCLIKVQGVDNYSDSKRPYEFGFTIDGQQHRHEKKGTHLNYLLFQLTIISISLTLRVFSRFLSSPCAILGMFTEFSPSYHHATHRFYIFTPCAWTKLRWHSSPFSTESAGFCKKP